MRIQLHVILMKMNGGSLRPTYLRQADLSGPDGGAVRSTWCQLHPVFPVQQHLAENEDVYCYLEPTAHPELEGRVTEEEVDRLKRVATEPHEHHLNTALCVCVCVCKQRL